MAWKKVVVSGSSAQLSGLNVDNTVTANSFSGNGASITGVVHNAGEIASQFQVLSPLYLVRLRLDLTDLLHLIQS